MPLINGGITAKSVEEYQRCEKGLAHLNSIVQTLNSKDVAVEITGSFFSGGGITVQPIVNAITQLRVKTNSQEESWVDYNLDKQLVSIRAGENLVYMIYLFPKEKK